MKIKITNVKSVVGSAVFVGLLMIVVFLARSIIEGTEYFYSIIGSIAIIMAMMAISVVFLSLIRGWIKLE